MKHIAQIQIEFAKTALKKIATNWDTLSFDAQKEYLSQHPASKRKLTAKPGQQGEPLSDLHESIDEKRQQLSQHKPDTKSEYKDIANLAINSPELAQAITENSEKFKPVAKEIAQVAFDENKEWFADGEEPDEVLESWFGESEDTTKMFAEKLNLDLTPENIEWIEKNSDWLEHTVEEELWNIYNNRDTSNDDNDDDDDN